MPYALTERALSQLLLVPRRVRYVKMIWREEILESWGAGALQNLRVLGVGSQVSGVRIKKKYKLKPETQNFGSGGLFFWSTHFPPQPAPTFEPAHK